LYVFVFYFCRFDVQIIEPAWPKTCQRRCVPCMMGDISRGSHATGGEHQQRKPVSVRCSRHLTFCRRDWEDGVHVGRCRQPRGRQLSARSAFLGVSPVAGINRGPNRPGTPRRFKSVQVIWRSTATVQTLNSAELLATSIIQDQ